MNPLSPAGKIRRVDDKLRAIREAWPTARITRAGDRLTAVAVIDNAHSTYIIEVDPDSTRSLWVKRDVDPDYGRIMVPAPAWVDGWVD